MNIISLRLFVRIAQLGGVSRAASDLLDWSAVEFAYVELADEYASSSSIMPQKKNPSTLELIRGKSAEVYGCLTELLTMVKGVNSGYYQDLQQTKIPLWRCLDTTRTSLEVMTGIVSTLQIKEDRMREKLKGSLVVAVELAETMVMEAGLSFREAYKLVGAPEQIEVAYYPKFATPDRRPFDDKPLPEGLSMEEYFEYANVDVALPLGRGPAEGE